MTRSSHSAALARAALGASMFGLFACSGEAKQGQQAIVAADSGGVRVLTIAGDPRELPALRVGDTITLHSVAEDFFGGNPQVAYALNDGRLLLSDGQATAIFDANGDFQGQFGRRGQGPGEFGRLSRLWQGQGDSLWAFDDSNRRLSRFSPSLEYLRSERLAAGALGGRGYDVWAGGVGDTTGVLEYVFSEQTEADGLRKRDARLGVWVIGTPTPVFGEARTFAEFQLLNSEEGAILIASAMSRSGQWQALGRCYVYGFADRWSFTLHAPDTSLQLRDLATLRAPQARRDAVTNEVREKFIAAMLGSTPPGPARDRFENIYREQLIYPDSTPHFSRVFTSRDGALWVQRFRGSTTDVPDHWTVVDLATPRAWRLDVPVGSRLLAVDSARALIATKDEDDVESQHWWMLPELSGIEPPAGCRVAD